jgi:hypothetical protein
MAFLAGHRQLYPTSGPQHLSNPTWGNVSSEHDDTQGFILHSAGIALRASWSYFLTLFLLLLAFQTTYQRNRFVWTTLLQALPTSFAQSFRNSESAVGNIMKGGGESEIWETGALRSAESWFQGAFLLGLILFFLRGTIKRLNILAALVACLSQLQGVSAEEGRTSSPAKTVRDYRRIGSAAARGAALSAEVENFVFFLLFLWLFVMVNLGLQRLGAILVFLIPFFPVAFALKSFASMGLSEQDGLNMQSTGVLIVSRWTVILPLIVLLFSAARNPRNTRLYLLACLTTITLLISQSMLSSGQSLQPSWLSRTINAATFASHIALWLLHLVDTIENHPFLESLFPALFGFAALLAFFAQDASLSTHLGHNSNMSFANTTASETAMIGTTLRMRELWPLCFIGLGLVILLNLRSYNLVLVLLAATAGTSYIFLNRGSKSSDTPIHILAPTEVESEDFQKSITIVNIASWATTVLILMLISLARFKRHQFPAFFPYILAPVLLHLAKTMIYQVEVTGSYERTAWNAFESTSVPSTAVLFTLAFGLAMLVSTPFNRWIAFVYCTAVLSAIFVPELLPVSGITDMWA